MDIIDEILSNGIVNGIAKEAETPKSKIIRPGPDLNTAHQNLTGQAMKLLEEGKFSAALQILNVCLGDIDEGDTMDLDTQVDNLIKSQKLSKLDISSEGDSSDGFHPDECNLLEKRCLVNMRLKRYNKVVHDAMKMLEFSSENPVAYKCLLAALCKMKKLDQANEVIRLWQKNSPRDLEMMECRTKLESLMVAVKNGIEASDAFSDIEELLGLNYDWLLLRKSKDPQWKYRPLPTSSRCSFVLCLQYRFGHCSLGEKCPDAHGEGELEEWKKRYEIENVTRRISSLKVDDGSMYIKDLLAKVQTASSKKSILSEEDIDQLQVSCTSALHTTVQQRKFKKFTWKFSAKATKPLTHISLLHEHHRQYFHISSCSFVGPSDSVLLTQSGKSEPSSQVVTPELSEAALAITGGNVTTYKYKVKVVFTPEVYGNFRQSVVFDVGDETKVVRNISVDVVPPLDDGDNKKSEKSSSPAEITSTIRNNVPWNFGNAEMIDGNNGEKVQSEKLGFALMGNASTAKSDSFMENTKDPLSKEHYKERMRFLLTQEERSRQEILAKYNVTTNVHLTEKYVVSSGFNEGMTRYAIDGALYGRINLFRDISEDTAVGRLILRSCSAVLLTKSERRKEASNSKLRVYLCQISDKSKNSVYLDLGTSCSTELDLKDGDILQFDIQFQLDRTAFIEQKKVIDQLEEEHLNMLFPDLAINCHIPWSPVLQWNEAENSKYRLNPKQREALIAITAENCKTPPILVIGPFGSGKTFTLAQCIKKILTQKNTRVMVCTHSNSAADLYIKEYLDSWVQDGQEEARPLRIYYEMRNLSSVHPVVLQYCTIEAMKFRPPSYDEVMKHRVIVVTLSTSYLLMEMNLPEDTFSHILLDEAAQAMESEAITPLMSAGKHTKLVLAGDHFQLSPELFSEEARNIHPSLLERLHALYSDSHPCKLMLSENYRSHSAIIQFVSDSFYTRKLECAKSQPVHDNYYPLTFFAARGEDVQDSESTSYYNMAEVFELTEKISELISSWPEKWGDYRDENAIGVLTPYADQVNRIRSRLRKKGLHSVSVERVFNVQGKQFRAVFLSTVRTFRPWVRILPEAVGNEVDLGFFSSPKLLNTALTRAQSLVAVVGDPVSLCSVGKCRRIWEDYIRICNESKSLFGITFLQLKQSILGVEMRLTWGLNPLANEFQPQKQVTKPATTVHSSVITGFPAQIPVPFGTTPQPTIITYLPPKGKPRLHHPQDQRYFPHPNVEHNQMLAHQGPPLFQGPHVVSNMVPRPFHGGIGLLQTPIPNQFPPLIGPHSGPVHPPWTPTVHGSGGPPVPMHHIPWQGPPQPVRAVGPYAVPGHFPGQPTYVDRHGNPYTPYPNVNHSQLNQPPPHVHQPAINSANEVYPAAHASHPYDIKGPSGIPGHSEYAGQPLYRRHAVPGFEERSNFSQTQSQQQPPPTYDQAQNANRNLNQGNLTDNDIRIITRALEQHASSGAGDHYGDIQSLKSKLLLQAASTVLADTGRPIPSLMSTPAAAPGSSAFHHGPGYSSTRSGSTQHGSVFAPIPHPQKSPAAPQDSRLSFSSSTFPETSNALHNRIWSNSNPPYQSSENPGGFGSHHSFQNDPNRLRGQANLEPLPVRAAFNQPLQPNTLGQFKPISSMPMNTPVPPQQSLPPPIAVSIYNNNTLPSYYEPGYQADVGGLKAQLSGGLRQQGFGERSAFSRVNGNQDDVITDNSGLGRSYANVVKAAVTTAAVGALVSTSVSSNSNLSRTGPLPQGIPLANSQLYPVGSKFFNSLGAPGQQPPNQNTFGPY